MEQMVTAGLVDHWKQKWMPAKKRCEEDEGQSARRIQLVEIQTVFYLAGAGVGLAVLTLGLEWVHAWNKRLTS